MNDPSVCSCIQGAPQRHSNKKDTREKNIRESGNENSIDENDDGDETNFTRIIKNQLNLLKVKIYT